MENKIIFTNIYLMNFLPTPQRTYESILATDKFELLPTFQTWLEIAMHVKLFNEGVPEFRSFQIASKKTLTVQ